nr:hypothetical protein [uncultured Chryseobacterium sp.]
MIYTGDYSLQTASFRITMTDFTLHRKKVLLLLKTNIKQKKSNVLAIKENYIHLIAMTL